MGQTAIIDPAGIAVAYTGRRCIAEAGHRTGPCYSVQASMRLKLTVLGAMAEAYLASKAPFAERLLEALKAAGQEGGDIRGRQSASPTVVRG